MLVRETSLNNAQHWVIKWYIGVYIYIYIYTKE